MGVMVALISILALGGVVYAANSYRITKGGAATVTVNEHGVCKNVKNDNATSDIFIPTKTSNEWSLFRSNADNVTFTNCVIIATGSGHSCAVINGAAKCWGNNDHGQLGDGTKTNRTTPVAVSGLSSGVTDISITTWHSCAIQNGAAKCWGENDHGQLGDGTKTDRLTPTTVSGLSSGVTDIEASVNAACAVHNGAAKCWGWASYEYSGESAQPDRTTPVTISGLSSGVTSISTSGASGCAIQNGAAKCWGYNEFGQLGDGTKTERPSPITPSGLSSGVTYIGMGGFSSCAIHNGAVKCWGLNAYYNRTSVSKTDNTGSLTPVAVSDLSSGIDSLAPAGWHACVAQNGAAKCWGLNASGEIGDGTKTNRLNQRTAVSGLSSGVTLVSAGTNHSCGVHNGVVKCWGSNYYGQIGDGTKTDRTTPVTVSGL